MGCETSGTVYWNPSSESDLIEVSKGDTNEANCNYQWCAPLTIQFTATGKRYPWNRQEEWGLRLYSSGQDPSLTFSIGLPKEAPVFKPFAIGPNPFFHPSVAGPFLPPPPSPPPIPSPPEPAGTPGPDSTAISPTAFRPTLPTEPVFTADLILQMVNACMVLGVACISLHPTPDQVLKDLLEASCGPLP